MCFGTGYRGRRRLAVAWVLIPAAWALTTATPQKHLASALGELPSLESAHEIAVRPSPTIPSFECGYHSPKQWLDELGAAVARGEIPDRATRVISPIQQGQPRTGSGIMPCLSPAHIFPFEDTNQILLTDYSTGQLLDLMVSAANDLMAAHGDIYDFVGFWLNFAPHHVIGTAAYVGLENDVTGIGVQSAVGTELFNLRADMGVGGQNIEGMLITWNINWPQWQPGTGPGAFMTRVALGHEFEHRFAMFLPDLLDGRRMQGYGGFGCYGAGHPNPGVDSQGSVLGIGDWVGSDPAVVQASFPDFFLFNSDTGGLWSYTELYLMGYVSPVEMDAGNSELRYMDDWDCVSVDYFGPISTISSGDIIAAAGPRVPDSTTEDKHYRTGWIMIHLPGDPPNTGQRAKAVAIHEQQQIDWSYSSLGLGTMNNSLFNDCNCNDVPDTDDIEDKSSEDCNDNDIPDECDIEIGESSDLNENGIPDECECPQDLDGDGNVDAADLAQLLGNWGPCPDCPADFDGDNDVDAADLAQLLGAWGECQ